MESRKEFITTLVSELYKRYDFLRVDSLDKLIDKALDKYLNSDLSEDEIRDDLLQIVINRKKEVDIRYDSVSVKNNHKLVYSKLKELVHLLNDNNIDYQLCGALCGYIKYGTESDRVHDDLDFNINEKDIDKFKKICISLGYTFEDNRLSSPRTIKNGIPAGEHEIIARDTNSDFHIGVFAFERLPDHTVINKLYYTDEEGNSCVREEVYSPELSDEIFPKEAVDFQGEKIFITPPEYVYSLKEFTQGEKDKHDIAFFKDKIDINRYKRIKKKKELGKMIRHIPVSSIQSYDDHNPFNDLDNMFDDGSNMEMTAPGIEEKPKQYVKADDDYGYSNFLLILLLTLVCLGFLFMSIMITKNIG